MNISCIIVDDEAIAREGLSGYVAEIPELQLLGTFGNALEANRFLQEQETDLIFLDIEMPVISGLEFIQSLPNPPMCIFTTAYREYAIDSYNLNGVDYLLKPISFNRFLQAVNKAQEYLHIQQAHSEKQKNSDFFFVKSNGKYIKIAYRDILFVEGLKDYTFIHVSGKRHLVLLSLKKITEQLPKDQFIRVHRSYLVALNKIQSIEGNNLRIEDKTIPIAKRLRAEVLDKIVGNNLWRRE